MKCTTCGKPATRSCTRCGRFFCEDHGGDRMVGEGAGPGYRVVTRGLCDGCAPSQALMALQRGLGIGVLLIIVVVFFVFLIGQSMLQPKSRDANTVIGTAADEEDRLIEEPDEPDAIQLPKEKPVPVYQDPPLPDNPLLQEIFADPDNDAPRLKYADWLAENGEPDRAEFIRVQIELAKMPKDDQQRADYQKRELDLKFKLTEVREGRHRSLDFRCGFVESIRFQGAEHFLEMRPAEFAAELDELCSRHPVVGVSVEYAPHFDGNDSMIASIPIDLIETLVLSSAAARLKHLHLANNGYGNPAAEVIASSPLLKNLRTLNLSMVRMGERIGEKGVQALASSPHLANLVELNLGGNQINAAAMRALLESPHLANLTTLHLYGIPQGYPEEWWSCETLDTEAVKVLAASPHSTRLTHLDLQYNNLGDETGRALSDSLHLANLTELKLDGNNFTSEVVQSLRAKFGDRLSISE